MYYMYVLQSERKITYIGYTSDLRKRLSQHNAGATRTTRGHAWKLVYYEAYRAMSDAKRRERQLKFRGQAVRQLKDRIRDSREQS